jgi:hypothetical protein
MCRRRRSLLPLLAHLPAAGGTVLMRRIDGLHRGLLMEWGHHEMTASTGISPGGIHWGGQMHLGGGGGEVKTGKDNKLGRENGWNGRK